MALKNVYNFIYNSGEQGKQSSPNYLTGNQVKIVTVLHQQQQQSSLVRPAAKAQAGRPALPAGYFF